VITPGLLRFRDKSVLVTGAAQGIGRATAERLAREGADVLIVDRAGDTASSVAASMRAEGLSASSVAADLSTWTGASEAMEKAVSALGQVDVLVNNVGGTIKIKPFSEYAEEEIVAELTRSLLPTVWSCRALVPHMVSRGRGAIVNVGSNAVRGIYRVPYAVAKGGVFALTTALAVELARTGVRVNCVAPGGTDVHDRAVPRNPDAPSEQEKSWAVEMRDFVRQQMPMARRGTVDEQAAAIAFMASDDASFITGQILSVAGGASVT
jgi:dihydroxycyclohexadiene carboxylate dehydrogenase